MEEFPLGPLDDNVEVKVEYGGLNFADVYTRLGMIPKDEFPFVLGIECSGIVTNPPKDSDNLKVNINSRISFYQFYMDLLLYRWVRRSFVTIIMEGYLGKRSTYHLNTVFLCQIIFLWKLVPHFSLIILQRIFLYSILVI